MSTPYYADDQVTLWHGHDLDVLRTLPDQAVNCIVTSPPYYGLRDYGQRGLEASPAEYVAGLVEVFAELRRVLADDGCAFLNLGDSYASGAGGRPGSTTAFVGRTGVELEIQSQSRGIGDRPHKSLLGIPWRVAFALQDDGWTLRNAIVWAKPNAMPESVTDRLSSRYELVFLLTKSARYWFDLDAVREPPDEKRNPPAQIPRKYGQGGANSINKHGWRVGPVNPGDVWTIPTVPFSGAHYAVMAPAVAERCIRAGCKPGGVVLDPYSGSGTTGMVALRNGRRYIGIDLNENDLDLSLRTRLQQGALIPDGEAIA